MRFFTVVVLGIFLPVCVVWGQFFPEDEYLYTVHITDGSILVGRIVGEVDIERLIEDASRRSAGRRGVLDPATTFVVEVYGGSRFTVRVDQTERVVRRRNPDYGAVHPILEIDNRLREVDTRSTAGRRFVVGIAGGYSRSRADGKDWEELLDVYDAKNVYGPKMGAETFVLFLHDLNPDSGRPFVWGARGAVGYYSRTIEFESGIDDPSSDEPFSQDADAIDVAVEALFGIGQRRVAGFVGAGLVFSSYVFGPETRSWMQDGLVDEFEYDQAFIPSALLSVGGVVRLGSSFTMEARLYYERQLRSWYSEFEQYYQAAPGWSLGLGYDFS